MGSQATGEGLEFAHLVHAVIAHLRQRPLAAFAVLGTLLFVGRHYVMPDVPELATLVIVVDSDATPTEVEQATNEGMLLEYAIRSGFVGSDTVVRDRLVRNVRFVHDAIEGDDALEEAIRLDMHRTDPVSRQRLIGLARQTLAASARTGPTDEALLSYLREHEERFRRPPTVSFEQVFVSRQRHADGFDARVRWVGARLDRNVSDPTLLPGRMARASRERVDARFGTGFAERVFALGGREWSLAIPSRFGMHYVRVFERTPGVLPPLEEVRSQVQHDFEHDSVPTRVRVALSRMRAAYRIVIEEST